MIQPISFFVHGTPKGQPRAKACRRGAHAGVYDPGTANEWKNQIYIHGKDSVPPKPLTMPLRVDLIFYFPRPKSHFRGKAHQLRDTAPTHHTSKPDRDNSDKAVLDQMTQMGFWRDDAQVCDGRIQKLYGCTPGLQVRISEAISRSEP